MNCRALSASTLERDRREEPPLEHFKHTDKFAQRFTGRKGANVINLPKDLPEHFKGEREAR